MARPKSKEELKDFRLVMMIAPSDVKAIDDWMFSHRIRSRAEAIRQLVTLGLRSSKDIGSVKLENELEAEFEKRCSAEPEECPQFIWESLLEERCILPQSETVGA